MRSILPAVVLVAAFGGIAQAQEKAPQDPPGRGGLEYSVEFDLWIPDLAGDVTVLDLVLEADFGDPFGNLEGAGAIHFEAWEAQSVGGFLDLTWVSVSQDPELPGGEGKIDFSMGFVEAAVASRMRHGDAYFDVFTGLRWVRLEGALETPGGFDEGNAKDYFDPMIGVRVGGDLATWLSVSMRIDLAGFGVGTELTGNFVLTAGVKVSPSVTLVGGWRSMGIEIDEDRFDLDVVLRGPLLAVNVGF